jgi:hypothetical protein
LAEPPAATAVPSLESLGLSAGRPLVIIDVDEVLGLFMRGFGDFVERQGYEMRVDRFALFQTIYRPQETSHIDVTEGRRLFEAFFRTSCGQMEPAPGAVEALVRLAPLAGIVILSNAPAYAEPLRRDWLARHGMAHPLILNVGPKGPVAAALIAQTRGPSAFVDDLLSNLDSVAAHCPGTATFQHVADERLRAYAPARPEVHRRIDDWAELGAAIEDALAAA